MLWLHLGCKNNWWSLGITVSHKVLPTNPTKFEQEKPPARSRFYHHIKNGKSF